MANGSVVFYPNYAWYLGYVATAEPVTNLTFTCSGGETSGSLYDIVDGKRSTVVTVDSDTDTAFYFDWDLSATGDFDFCVIDEHNLKDIEANTRIQNGAGTTQTINDAWSGPLGGPLAAENISSNIVDIPDYNEMLLIHADSSFSDNEFRVYVSNGEGMVGDATIGEITFGLRFEPSIAPEILPIEGANYDGVTVRRTKGGQNISHGFYGERKVWRLKWNYMNSTDFAALQTVIQATSGPRYPFYIDLGESATPHLYFVRFLDNHFHHRKLTTGAYEVSLLIESEVDS
jgi:hypothetical protein